MIDNYVIQNNWLTNIANIGTGQPIWTQKGWSEVVSVEHINTEVYRLETNGGTIVLPESVVVCGGRKVKISNAKHIDILRGPVPKQVNRDTKIVMDGLMIGDGSVYRGNTYTRYLNIGQKDQDYFTSEIKDLIIGRQPSTHNLGWKIDTNILEEELPHLPERSIPDRYVVGGPDIICAFLRGLYSANGTASNGRIGLRSTNYKLIRQVQIMLSSVGIRSYVSYAAPRLIKWSNGSYVSKEAYDLNTNMDRGVYYKLIGFLQKYKCVLIAKKLRFSVSQGEQNTYEILEKKSLGNCNYTKIKVANQFNTYWCNGLNVCGD